jgi:hypothetical protein
MKRRCRGFPKQSWLRPNLTWQQLLPHAVIVTDPKKLAQLNAALAKRKQETEGDADFGGNA